MKNKFAISAGILMLAGLGLAFAAPETKAPAAPAQTQAAPDSSRFKDILIKLVRQDEYLDEALDTLDASKGRLSSHDLSAMGLSLKMISNNLRHVAALNKEEFASVQPGSADAKYIAAIFSYSRKVDRKAARVGGLVTGLAAKSKKASMRDAVSSRRTGRKAKGKKLTQLLEEQKAMAALAADVRSLRAASRGLSATSKWLYIASK